MGKKIYDSLTIFPEPYTPCDHIDEDEGQGGFLTNIHFGSTPPEDTNKIWVKSEKPASIEISNELEYLSVAPCLEAELPVSLSYPGTAMIGSKIYIFGGSISGTTQDTIYSYDVNTEEVILLDTKLPSANYMFKCSVLNDKIYLIGGYSRGSQVLCFDPEIESITTLNSLTTTFYGHAQCVIKDKIYLSSGAYPGSTGYRSSVFCVEISGADTILTELGGSMGGGGRAVWLPASCSLGSDFYVIGGKTNGAGISKEIYKYNIDTGISTTVGSLPVSLNEPGAVAEGKSIYAFTNSIYKINTETSAVETLKTKLPSTSIWAHGNAFNNNIYLVLGKKIALFKDLPKVQANVLKIRPLAKQYNRKVIDSDNFKMDLGLSEYYYGGNDNYGNKISALFYDENKWKDTAELLEYYGDIDEVIAGTGANLYSFCSGIKNYMAYYNNNLKSVYCPNATFVGQSAFQSCQTLTKAYLPKVTSIGTRAFYEAYTLQSLYAPEVETIGENAFYYVRRLDYLDFHKLKSIGSSGLTSCYSLKTLIIRSQSICQIKNNCLSGCYHITGVQDSQYNPNGDHDGYIYVPKALLSDEDETMDYRRAEYWSTYATQFRALEDYTIDGTTTGELDPNKI